MLDVQKKKAKNRKRTHSKVKENSSVRTLRNNSELHKNLTSNNSEDSNSSSAELNQGIALRNEVVPTKRGCSNFPKVSHKSAPTSHAQAHFLGQSTAFGVETTSGKAGETIAATESFNDEINSILSAIDLDKSFDASPDSLDGIVSSSEDALPPVDVGLGLGEDFCVVEESSQEIQIVPNQDSFDAGDSLPEVIVEPNVKYQFDSGFVSESNDLPVEPIVIEDSVITPVPVIDSYTSNIYPDLDVIKSAPLDEDSDIPESLPTLDSIEDLPEERGLLLSHMKETLKAITEKIPTSKSYPETVFQDPEPESQFYLDQEEGPPKLLDPHGISINPELPLVDQSHSKNIPKIIEVEDFSDDQSWSLTNEDLSLDKQSTPVRNNAFSYNPSTVFDFHEDDPWKDVSEEEIDVEALYPSPFKLKWTGVNPNDVKITSVTKKDNLPPSPDKVILRIKRTNGVVSSSTDILDPNTPETFNSNNKCDSSSKYSSHSSRCSRYKKKKSKHKKHCRHYHHHHRSNDKNYNVKVLRRNSPNSYEVCSKIGEEDKNMDFSDYLKRVGEVKFKRIKLKYGQNSSLNIDIPPIKHKKVS